jgi:hypothetical protein
MNYKTILEQQKSQNVLDVELVLEREKRPELVKKGKNHALV